MNHLRVPRLSLRMRRGRLTALAAGAVATLAFVAGPAASPAQAACGNWYQSAPNRIVSFDYACTYYFDTNGWYVAGFGCTGSPNPGVCYWILGRDGT
jgi:hypothetical protein